MKKNKEEDYNNINNKKDNQENIKNNHKSNTIFI